MFEKRTLLPRFSNNHKDTKKFTDIVSVDLKNVPEEYSIYNPFPIYDQGRTSMCMAYSLKLIKQLQEFKETGELIDLSEGYLYANKWLSQEGMVPGMALNNLARRGTCESRLFNAHGTYEQVNNEFKKLTGEQCLQLYNNAQKYAIKDYCTLKDKLEVMEYLVKYGACAITIDVYYGFKYRTSKRTGIVPKPYGSPKGGHCMVITGVKKIGSKYYYAITNSWGEKWGLNGTCYMDVDSKEIRGIYGLIDETKYNKEITLEIGYKKIRTKQGTIEMDVAPFIKDNRTFVPVRFVSEALGRKVEWIPPKTVKIL